jgi:hypothetical protein
MARIDTAKLILQATDVADRAYYVRQDPAVIKAAREAWADLAQARRSSSRLVMEAGSAWRRASDRSRSKACAEPGRSPSELSGGSADLRKRASSDYAHARTGA